jgi:exopolysaccharide biosynthesis predicted pyruvyltransferase EpsI
MLRLHSFQTLGHKPCVVVANHYGRNQGVLHQMLRSFAAAG